MNRKPRQFEITWRWDNGVSSWERGVYRNDLKAKARTRELFDATPKIVEIVCVDLANKSEVARFKRTTE